MESQSNPRLDYLTDGTDASSAPTRLDRAQAAEIRLAIAASEIGNRALELFTDEQLTRREEAIRLAGSLLLVASNIFKKQEIDKLLRQPGGPWELSEKETASRILQRIPLAMYEVLTALAKGASRAGVASEFGIDEGYLSHHMRIIYEMLEVNQPADALQSITALVRLSGHGDLLEQEIPEEDPMDHLHETFAELTATELDILGCICLGLANKQIAEARFVTEQTVKFHLTSIYRKLGVHNRTAAATLASRGGLVEWAASQDRASPHMKVTRAVIAEKTRDKG